MHHFRHNHCSWRIFVESWTMPGLILLRQHFLFPDTAKRPFTESCPIHCQMDGQSINRLIHDDHFRLHKEPQIWYGSDRDIFFSGKLIATSSPSLMSILAWLFLSFIAPLLDELLKYEIFWNLPVKTYLDANIFCVGDYYFHHPTKI